MARVANGLKPLEGKDIREPLMFNEPSTAKVRERIADGILNRPYSDDRSGSDPLAQAHGEAELRVSMKGQRRNKGQDALTRFVVCRSFCPSAEHSR